MTRSGREPITARLHFIPRLVNRVQRPITEAFRGYFERSPNWVLLTTKGRRTGLPREILLPCTRAGGDVIVISTYGHRSNWIKNIAQDPNVEITVDGRKVGARAEVVEDVPTKQRLVSAHPFFAPMPLGPLNALMRPLMPAPLRRWVVPRPVVVLRPLR